MILILIMIVMMDQVMAVDHSKGVEDTCNEYIVMDSKWRVY